MQAEIVDALTPMAKVLAIYPGAQRALFRRYHIGGCSSCSFGPEETLGELCRRNHDLSVEEVIEHLQTSQAQDDAMQISAGELAELIKERKPMHLLDIRTRSEWDTVRINGAVRMSQETMQLILTQWPRQELLVIYDHNGSKSLDAAAYFSGQGFSQVRGLRGGIDAWAADIDPTLPRYRLEPAAKAEAKAG